MHRISTLWKANAIVFASSFCVMVIELVAARILAPHIGVSLYTWTSIIGVILAGIALGNYLGGKLADKHPSPLILSAIFFAGGLLTVLILPAVKLVTSVAWFSKLPLMLSYTLQTAGIFFLPAIVLSMVSPLVIKLTLADLGQTGGVVGTIYACSTAGSILGTFLTGFYFILWFGTSMIIWLVGAALILMGVIALFAWKIPGRWKLSLKNLLIWTSIIEVVLVSAFLFQFRGNWEPKDVRESNYYTIQVWQGDVNVKLLVLDALIHSYVRPDSPTFLVYDYVKIFAEVIGYVARDNPAPSILHLGGGGYSLPRFMETVNPNSINEVVEIDPMVTQVAHEELGLPADTTIKTYNEDARQFLIQMEAGRKYDFVVGDVFNGKSTPFHLTTLEFDKLVKAHLQPNGVYMVNVIDDYARGKYMASFVHTLRQAFKYVYLFSIEGYENPGGQTFVLAATEKPIDLAAYRSQVKGEGRKLAGMPHDEASLDKYVAQQSPLLLTDDYVPTDILVTWLFH